jgi:hypothetical protein
VGAAGTGKTRLAREIGARLGRRIIETSESPLTDASLSALGLTLKYGERLVTMDRLRAAIEMTSEAVRLERAQDKR